MEGSMDYAQVEQMTQAFGTTYYVTLFIVAVLSLVAMWKLFSKAGEAGWKAIIPIYNIYTAIKLYWSGANAVLMTVLMFVPLVNCVIALILAYKMIAAYGKGVGFFILSLFFSPIPQLILAFGSSQYIGPQ